MILVNDRQGYRVCLECHEEFEAGEEARHIDCAASAGATSAV